ncbi:MAG: hypothetical protein JXQ30_13025 [Spirochaetes bacterium]|nr:hypothetical protein [Spirochaetota bacterium]
MKLANMQSVEKGSEPIIVDLVKRVLENRVDVVSNDGFVLDVAHYTIEKTKIARLIAESNILQKRTAEIREEYKLSRIIECLAIVNRAIDVVSHRNESMNLYPG